MRLPALNRARATAKGVACTGNLKQAMTGQLMYADSFKGFLCLGGVDWYAWGGKSVREDSLGAAAFDPPHPPRLRNRS